jgi:hypothetical protein
MLHNSPIGNLEQEWKEFPGEEKVRQVIGLHLDIVTILGGHVVQSHDTSIVAQPVEFAALDLNGSRSRSELAKACKSQGIVSITVLLPAAPIVLWTLA